MPLLTERCVAMLQLTEEAHDPMESIRPAVYVVLMAQQPVTERTKRMQRVQLLQLSFQKRDKPDKSVIEQPFPQGACPSKALGASVEHVIDKNEKDAKCSGFYRIAILFCSIFTHEVLPWTLRWR